jgi:EAL domain-containing protein (putative c-di-GMP-specific phosphodiesterase class I)
VPEDDDAAQIALAIIGLARSLGLRTLAEGVETREQLEFFRYHGCNEAQGFLLAQPMPAEAVPAWLTSFAGAAAGAPRW